VTLDRVVVGTTELLVLDPVVVLVTLEVVVAGAEVVVNVATHHGRVSLLTQAATSDRKSKYNPAPQVCTA
jgi:hypothetical protein